VGHLTPKLLGWLGMDAWPIALYGLIKYWQITNKPRHYSKDQFTTGLITRLSEGHANQKHQTPFRPFLPGLPCMKRQRQKNLGFLIWKKWGRMGSMVTRCRAFKKAVVQHIVLQQREPTTKCGTTP